MRGGTDKASETEEAEQRLIVGDFEAAAEDLLMCARQLRCISKN
jgi:hypothetical protein